jgi:hypothetical protein
MQAVIARDREQQVTVATVAKSLTLNKQLQMYTQKKNACMQLLYSSSAATTDTHNLHVSKICMFLSLRNVLGNLEKC